MGHFGRNLLSSWVWKWEERGTGLSSVSWMKKSFTDRGYWHRESLILCGIEKWFDLKKSFSKWFSFFLLKDGSTNGQRGDLWLIWLVLFLSVENSLGLGTLGSKPPLILVRAAGQREERSFRVPGERNIMAKLDSSTETNTAPSIARKFNFLSPCDWPVFLPWSAFYQIVD